MPRIWFEEWRDPVDFHHASATGVRAYFQIDKAPPPYLREAYVVGAFGRIWRDDQSPCEVRLVAEAEQFPDGQLKAEGVCLNLEVTMALPKNKRMFDEWRELRAKSNRGEFVPAEWLEQRQANAREAIPRIIAQKAGKRYAVQARTTLLVYTDDGRALSAAEMAVLTEPWKDSFEAIYLLSGMDAVMTWPTLRILRGKEPF